LPWIYDLAAYGACKRLRAGISALAMRYDNKPQGNAEQLRLQARSIARTNAGVARQSMLSSCPMRSGLKSASRTISTAISSFVCSWEVTVQ
jgi:hypothetical protein